MIENLIKDFPTQFQDKKNIRALCSAFDIQVAELIDAFMEIKNNTSLDTAVGKQLDLIGDIVGLTRIEGALLCGNKNYYDVLDDEVYRQYLKYKSYKNSNGCTYYDVIEELMTVSGIDNIKYEEDELYPATVVVTLPLSDRDKVLNIGGIPTISPAGVSFLYKFSFGETTNVWMDSEIHVAQTASCGTFYCGTFPSNA